METAPLAVAIPLLGAGTLAAVSGRVRRAGAETVAIAAAVAVTALCVTLLVRTGSGIEVYWFGGWEPRDGTAIGVSFAVDAIGAGLPPLSRR